MIEILKTQMGNFLVSDINPEDEGAWMFSGFFTAEQIEAWRITTSPRVKIVGEKSVMKELGFLRPKVVEK